MVKRNWVDDWAEKFLPHDWEAVNLESNIGWGCVLKGTENPSMDDMIVWAMHEEAAKHVARCHNLMLRSMTYGTRIDAERNTEPETG